MFEKNGNGKTWKNSEGQYHREDGPAVECLDGTRIWYVNGQLHREDGPAIVRLNGGHEYYIKDRWFPKERYMYLLKKRKIYL